MWKDQRDTLKYTDIIGRVRNCIIAVHTLLSNMATRPSLEDLLKDIPRQKLNQSCRDDHLSKIALSLTDWQSVAPFLGLTEADEEEIKRDYSNTKTQKIAMLRKWKKRYGRKAETCNSLLGPGTNRPS